MYLDLYEKKKHGTIEYPFQVYHIQNPRRTFMVPVHWHHEFEIIYIKKGNINISISGEDYIGTDNSIFFVNSGELHFISTSTRDIDYYNFIFPLDFISFKSNDVIESNFFGPLKNGTLHLIHTTLDTEALDICNLISETESTSYIDQFKIRILLLSLFQFAVNNNLLSSKASTFDTIEREMLTFIQQNYIYGISLKELSTHFHMSEKYISRYFKEHFKIPLTQYVNHLKLNKAKSLLKSTSLSITDIALQCGFQNVSYFIRTYKSTYGISPLQYRLSHNKKD